MPWEECSLFSWETDAQENGWWLPVFSIWYWPDSELNALPHQAGQFMIRVIVSLKIKLKPTHIKHIGSILESYSLGELSKWHAVNLIFTFGNMLIGIGVWENGFRFSGQQVKTIIAIVGHFMRHSRYSGELLFHLVMVGDLESGPPSSWLPPAILTGMLFQGTSCVSPFYERNRINIYRRLFSRLK